MLFVVITVFAVWLESQVSIVRERKSMRTTLEEACGTEWKPYNMVWNNNIISFGIRGYHLSWVRTILGDEPVRTICLPPTMP